MDRLGWTRVGAVLVALLLTGALTSCGSKTEAPATNKRLGDQGPCDLAKVDDLEKIFGSVDGNNPPKQEGPQCFYSFANGHPAIGRAADAARNGESMVLDGAAAKKFEKNDTCAVDVWLVPGDINQQFGVVVIGGCDPAITVARLILNKLPG